jgi:flagellar biosynthesis/type III secretory pathway protein FliH
MQITMTLEEFEEAKAKAHKDGYNQAVDELTTGLKQSYDDMTKGFFSRIGREANIEFTRRLYNALIKCRKS